MSPSKSWDILGEVGLRTKQLLGWKIDDPSCDLIALMTNPQRFIPQEPRYPGQCQFCGPRALERQKYPAAIHLLLLVPRDSGDSFECRNRISCFYRRFFSAVEQHWRGATGPRGHDDKTKWRALHFRDASSQQALFGPQGLDDGAAFSIAFGEIPGANVLSTHQIGIRIRTTTICLLSKVCVTSHPRCVFLNIFNPGIVTAVTWVTCSNVFLGKIEIIVL